MNDDLVLHGADAMDVRAAAHALMIEFLERAFCEHSSNTFSTITDCLKDARDALRVYRSEKITTEQCGWVVHHVTWIAPGIAGAPSAATLDRLRAVCDHGSPS